jgi:3-dehydroquinate dehydratase-2
VNIREHPCASVVNNLGWYKEGELKFLIINGPNLNLLGKRDTTIYGADTLSDINDLIKDHFENDKFDFFQSNHEGDIIDKIHQAGEKFNGIVINPGAYAHYSYAIRDAIEACSIPVIEVHLSNIYEREDFRRVSVTAPACAGIITGEGKLGYIKAVEKIKEYDSD